MTCQLCIWDPQAHAATPASADAAIDTMEHLEPVVHAWFLTLRDFVHHLQRRYDEDTQMDATRAAGFQAFWGSDPIRSAATCKSAVWRLEIAPAHRTRQISYAVSAAAELGLVMLDDDNGMCFLPDGTVLPEDAQAMWADDLAQMQAGPPDPALKKKGDGRTFWERLGGDLFDAIGDRDKRS